MRFKFICIILHNGKDNSRIRREWNTVTISLSHRSSIMYLILLCPSSSEEYYRVYFNCMGIKDTKEQKYLH